MEGLNKLLKQQTTTNFILNRVLAKIEVLKTNSKINNCLIQTIGKK